MEKSPYIAKLEELTAKMPDIPIYLQHLFTQSHDMMVVADSEGKFTWVNKYTETLLGYTRQEIYDIEFIKLVHPDDLDRTLDVYDKLLHQKGYQVKNFANRYLAKDGRPVPLCWNTTPIIDGYIYCIGRHCALSNLNVCIKNQ